VIFCTLYFPLTHLNNRVPYPLFQGKEEDVVTVDGTGIGSGGLK